MSYITAGVLSLLGLVVFIILILAVNQLHKLPDIKASLESIEKMLRYLVKLEKDRAEGKDTDTLQQGSGQEKTDGQ